MPGEFDTAGPEEPTAAHPGLGAAALGAAGEAAAFFAGAPIAGAADAAIGLGEVVTDHEVDTPARKRSPLLWVVLIVLVAAVVIWFLKA